MNTRARHSLRGGEEVLGSGRKARAGPSVLLVLDRHGSPAWLERAPPWSSVAALRSARQGGRQPHLAGQLPAFPLSLPPLLRTRGCRTATCPHPELQDRNEGDHVVDAVCQALSSASGCFITEFV